MQGRLTVSTSVPVVAGASRSVTSVFGFRATMERISKISKQMSMGNYSMFLVDLHMAQLQHTSDISGRTMRSKGFATMQKVSGEQSWSMCIKVKCGTHIPRWLESKGPQQMYSFALGPEEKLTQIRGWYKK